MIIVINGAYGVGKSTTAKALAEVIPNAAIFDPDDVAQLVRKVTVGLRLQAEPNTDFEDLAVWRKLIVSTMEALASSYERVWLVPITISKANHLEEIKTGFSLIDSDLYHFSLTASLGTIRYRLTARGDTTGTWAWRRAEALAVAFGTSTHETLIDTDQHSTSEIVAEIVSFLPL